jgi:hypothetical protein
MSKLPDTFCVFILTHGRPDNVITFKTLEKCGYTGRLYLVVDNEDKTAEQYKARFGAERVIVFDKKAEADRCDEGNNFDERRTITMARNACFEIAERLGVTHFLELDDDYSCFRYRFVDKYTTKGESKILDRAFIAMLDFYKSINAKSIAFAQGGDFIGGEGCAMLSNYMHRSRKCMNSFFCSTERKFRFVGAMNEDVNTFVSLGSRGGVFLTIPFIGLEQAPTQSQTGGITDMYQRYGTYCKAFTTVMMMPSAVYVNMMRSVNPRLHHRFDWTKCVPCIISEKHRRNQERGAE